MRIYVDVYDSNGEWQGMFECPLDPNELREEYGDGYRLKNWVCEYDDANPILESLVLNFANNLSKLDLDKLLSQYYEKYPEHMFYPMRILDNVVNTEGKTASEILRMFKNFSLEDQYFRFDGCGGLESFTEEQKKKYEDRYTTDMLYGTDVMAEWFGLKGEF